MEATAKVYDIYFDQTIDAVVMDWSGYATSDQFKEGTELMLNTLICNGSFKVLADIRSMSVIAGEDQQWLNSRFLPRATDFGFKVIAIVRPEHYFNKVAVESIAQKIDGNKLAVKFFDTRSQAQQWLGLIERPH